MSLTDQREIEFMIAVDTSKVPDDDTGRKAIEVEREWEFKYAIDFDARRLFGPLDGSVDGDLRFVASGHVDAPDGIEDVDELKASAQRRIAKRSLVENPPELDEALFSGCRMTKYGWVLESSFSAWSDSSRGSRWNLATACEVYEAGTGNRIDPAVREKLLMCDLQLIVRFPLVPQGRNA